MKKLIAIALAGVLTLAMTACGAQNSAADTTAATTAAATAATETTAETTEAAKISGTVTLAGSTSMQKLCEAMIESFELRRGSGGTGRGQDRHRQRFPEPEGRRKAVRRCGEHCGR